MPTISRQQIRSNLISDRVVDGLIQFLQDFFSTIPNLTWDPEDVRSRIIIHDFDAFNLDSVDKRPRIAVELVESHWQNIVVDKLESSVIDAGTKTLSDLVQCTATLHCISVQSLEAKNLADMVFESIRIFRPEIRKETGFFDIDSQSIGREQRIRTSSQPEVRAVPVTITVLLQRRHLRVEDRQRFETFSP